jgi:hypothetical protein
MKMNYGVLSIARYGLALLALSMQFFTSPLIRAAAVSVNPVSVSSDYSGQVVLTVTGLANGQAVLVEKFADLNGNNTIDSVDAMVQSFRVTDGQTASIGGVRNTNIPGDDDDGVNGEVHSTINFRIQEADRGVGRYIYRVSPANVGFVPVTTEFTVSQPSYPQKVAGRVLSGAGGVPYALVALLNIAEHQELVTATSADASGNFTLNADAGTYAVVGFKSGFLFDFQNAPVVTLQPGFTSTQNITLSTAGARTISGRVLDASSGAGIPGVQIFAESSIGLVTLIFSDAKGEFSAPVSASASDWELSVSDSATTLLGYLEHQREKVNTSMGSVSGVNLRLTKGSALIYGRFVDHQNRPLNAIAIRAEQGDQFAGNGVTDGEGNYCISVAGGESYVWPEEESLAALGLVAQGARVTLSANQAMRADLTARRVTAHLRGRVVDDTGAPVSEIGFGASDFGENNIFTQTDASGSFEIGVFGGTWHLQLENEDAQERGLLGPDSVFAVTDGKDVAGIIYVARGATARINGSLRDSTGRPLSSVLIYGSATVSGQTYRVNTETDANGAFRIGVFGALWQIGVGCSDLIELGVDCVQDQSVTISGGDRTVNFVAQAGFPIRIDSQSLPNGAVGIAYSVPMIASGGTKPYTWSHLPGSAPMPPGLDFSNSAGVIQGIPASSGIYSFAVRVMDATGLTADKVLTISIAPATVTSPSFGQPERLYDGRVRLLLHNVSAGQTYIIEASDDLRTWSTRATISASGNVVELTDTLAPGLIRCFYRARAAD